MDPQNLEREEEYFLGMGIKVVTGSWYLGGFVKNRESDDSLLVEKVQGCTELVKTLSGVAHNHPQSAYTGLQNSLQQEWGFVQ